MIRQGGGRKAAAFLFFSVVSAIHSRHYALLLNEKTVGKVFF